MTFTELKNKINSDIKIVDKEDDNGFVYPAFENVPDELKIDKKDRGNKVWIASEFKTVDCYLTKIKEDGVFVKFKGEVPIRAFYPDEVIIHPDLWSKKRLNYSPTVKNKFA